MPNASYKYASSNLLANHLYFLNGNTCDLPWLLALSVSWWTSEFSSHIYSLYFFPRACNVFLWILKWVLVLYRRYIAMVEMCQVIDSRDQLIALLVPLAEHMLNVILIHFQDRWTWNQRFILVFIFTICHLTLNVVFPG